MASLSVILLVGFLNILFNSYPVSGFYFFGHYDCDLADLCNGRSQADCEMLNGNCINGYRKWENYSGNILELVPDPKKDIEITIQPVDIQSMKNLSVELLVFRCSEKDCSTQSCSMSAEVICDFKTGNFLYGD